VPLFKNFADRASGQANQIQANQTHTDIGDWV
jgi:hypothetical protein